MAATDKQANVPGLGSSLRANEQDWPALPLGQWESTYHTLHLWTQIVGKIRLGLAPLQNHWWNAALYVSARGLTTSAMPYEGRAFEIEFDFIHHRLEIRTPDGGERFVPLAPKSVAAFYRELFAALKDAGINIQIYAKPQEIPDPIPFERDETPQTVHIFRVRPGICEPFVADLAVDGSCVSGISLAVPRQAESRSFFLGQLRFVLHAV